jgi:hypothetical protein
MIGKKMIPIEQLNEFNYPSKFFHLPSYTDQTTMPNFYLGVIIVLVFVLAYVVVINTSRHESHIRHHLRGLWIADDDFCNDAGIDGMIIYIGEYDSEISGHKAYLIMYSGNAVVVEKKFSFQIGGYVPDFYLLHQAQLSKSLWLKDEEPESEETMELKEVMPLELRLEIDFGEGSMVWKDEDKVYARLYKDNYSSLRG